MCVSCEKYFDAICTFSRLKALAVVVLLSIIKLQTSEAESNRKLTLSF